MHPARLLCCTVFLTIASAPAASLSYVSGTRQLTCGPLTLDPPGEFAPWDDDLSFLFPSPEAGSTASQRSTLSSTSVHVVSDATGNTFRGMSFFIIRFTLDETTACTLTGSLMLLGASGTSCISLVNLAHQEQSIINEILIAPPGPSDSRSLNQTHVLEPGTYILDAMVYSGGNNSPTSASLEMVFSIPEPAVSLPVFAGGILALRRRRAPLLCA